MTNKDTVWSWQGYMSIPLREATKPNSWNHQARCILNAPSKAACARAAGEKYPHNLFNLGNTGNKKDIAMAQAHPGVILWQPDSGPYRDRYFLEDGTMLDA